MIPTTFLFTGSRGCKALLIEFLFCLHRLFQSCFCRFSSQKVFKAGIPLLSSGWDSVLPLQGILVPSLVWAGRSHKPRGMAKKVFTAVFVSAVTVEENTWISIPYCHRQKSHSIIEFHFKIMIAVFSNYPGWISSWSSNLWAKSQVVAINTSLLLHPVPNDKTEKQQ